ncbi:UNVERIFIED_CONTAM: hypothetical protein NCL1_35141 [Trichonephila clavipes]
MLFGFYKISQWVFGIGAVGFINFFVRMQLISGQQVLDTTPASELKRLRTNLLDKYDKHIRPIKDTSQSIRVLIYYDVKHILALDEKYQILTVEGILMMEFILIF